MIDHGKVISSVKPEPLVIDDYSVWEHTDIQILKDEHGNETALYVSHMVQYTKDEFILLQAERHAELDKLINTILGDTDDE